jgi:hypothetical protein
MHGEDEKCVQTVNGTPEEKRPVRRPKSKWEDNIQMNHREIGWKDVHWVRLSQERDRWRALVNTVMKLRSPGLSLWQSNYQFLKEDWAPWS